MYLYNKKHLNLKGMKSIIPFVALFILFSFSLNAQDSTKTKNLKQETITRVVVVKDTSVRKEITNKVIEEEQIIIIIDTGEENQDIKFSTDKKEKVNVIDDVKVYDENKEMIKAIEEDQKKEIEESRKDQLIKAQEEKKIIDQRKEVLEMKRLEKKKDSLKKKVDN